MRILYVAAFAVSGYASTESRPCKPFNPLLGETYEADYPEKGIRFFSEKVSLVSNASAFLIRSSVLKQDQISFAPSVCLIESMEVI
jgi:hypothetical protein